MGIKAIFLDRDGVLNDSIVREGKPYPPSGVEEIIISDDVLPALSDLKALGYILIGVTNQPDVARGKTSRSTVELINNEILRQLPLDEMRVCYHDDADNCVCRKPEPGLLLQAVKDYSIDLKRSFMIGDRWRDVEAGQRAGCRTIWINRNYQESNPKTLPDKIVASLGEAANWIAEIDNQPY